MQLEDLEQQRHERICRISSVAKRIVPGWLVVVGLLTVPAVTLGQDPNCPSSPPPASGDVLVAQAWANLVGVDPDAPGSQRQVIDRSYSAVTFDAQGRLIANRSTTILEVDLDSCTEKVLSDPNGSPPATVPGIITVGNVLYATYQSGTIRGVIQVDPSPRARESHFRTSPTSEIRGESP
jgi:hypothetical protein